MADVKITVTRSAGNDGAVVVMVDTSFEPDGSDGGPGLRVLVNDDPAFSGRPYVDARQPRKARYRTLEVNARQVEYLPDDDQAGSILATRRRGAERRMEILSFVEAYGAREHRSPTLAEIATGVGLVGPSSVWRHVAKLVAAGLLEHEANEAGRQGQRTIRVSDAGHQVLVAATTTPHRRVRRTTSTR
jgi:DNA-binding MarR family transcriptional regulator